MGFKGFALFMQELLTIKSDAMHDRIKLFMLFEEGARKRNKDNR
jgi:DNA-directed RNA polymerase beta subunit